MSARPGATAWGLALAALASGPFALAQETPPVALSGDPAEGPTARIRLELQALGHAVLAPGDPRASVTVTVAPREGALLRATVTLADGRSRVVSLPVAQPDAETLFAVRVVEAVRASGLPLRAPPPRPSPGPLAPTAEAPRAATSVGLGVSMAISPGGVGALVAPRLRVAYAGRFGVESWLSWPSAGGSLDAGGEPSRVSLLDVGAGGFVALARTPGGRIDLGARVGYLRVAVSPAPSEGAADLASLSAAFGAAARVWGPLSARLDASLGLALPSVAFRDARGRALPLSWGGVLVGLSASVELGL